MKDISSKVSIRPFSSAEDLAWRTRPANVKKDNVGFMTMTLKKPRSCRPYGHTLHRMKWSQEMEKMPPLDIMNKTSRAAFLGNALSNTKTSLWCSRSSNIKNENNNKNLFLSATKEEGEPFILPESTGEIITKQLRQGSELRIRTSEFNKRGKNSPPKKHNKEDCVLEPVPLCFDNELERKNVKVLTATPPTVYKALPIVSETYPLIYNTDQYQHEPFRSSGFHCLDTPRLQNSFAHSTIIRVTDFMPKVPHRLTKTQPEKKTMRTRSIHMLSADGNVVKYPNDGPLFLQFNDAMPSPGAFTNTSKSSPFPLRTPVQSNIMQTHVGPVVNGINPNQDAKRSPSDNLKTVQKMTSAKLILCRRVTQPQSRRSVATQNGSDFIVISKPLQSNLKSNQKLKFVARQHFHEEIWSREIANISHNNYGMSQVTDDESFRSNEESFSASRLNSSVDHTSQDEPHEMSRLDVPHFLKTSDDSNTCSEAMSSTIDSETSKPNPHLQSHAINIPTAESE